MHLANTDTSSVAKPGTPHPDHACFVRDATAGRHFSSVVKPSIATPYTVRSRPSITRRRGFASSAAPCLSSSSTSNDLGSSASMAQQEQVNVVSPEELVLQCADGVTLAAQSWRTPHHSTAVESPTTHRILCLHGWMDNCRSFHHLAPVLVQNATHGVHLVALDLPGHGQSSHKSMDGPPTLLAESAYYVSEALRVLGWNNNNDNDDNGKNTEKNDETTSATAATAITLMGHSMGAAISCLYAAAFGEQVARLVLLEGAGPLARNPNDVAKHVRAHVERRSRQLTKVAQQQATSVNGNNKSIPSTAALYPRRRYPSLEKAVAARCATAQSFPGNQWLSTAAAREMVLRGTEPAHSNAEVDSADDDAPLYFRHDPRLQWPSVQYFTQEQTEALYKDITCPTALLLADDGWPFDEERLQRSLKLLEPTLYQKLPGSHHFHADPESAEAVAQAVRGFLQLS